MSEFRNENQEPRSHYWLARAVGRWPWLGRRVEALGKLAGRSRG